MRAHVVFCLSGLSIPRYKVKPLFGSSYIVTALDANVTLAWVCHNQGNHTLDKVHWSLYLHSGASRSSLLTVKRDLAGNIQITPKQGRLQWTGDISQGKLSFVIYDVRRSDDLLYRLTLTLFIPEKDSNTVVHRKSYFRVKVAGILISTIICISVLLKY